MEFKAAVGALRTFQYFEPFRPVERAKVQTILEAGRLASRAVNTAFSKAIVAYNASLTAEEREALKTPLSATLFDVAPVYVFWYYDMDARRRAVQEKKWPTVASGALVEIGALGPPHGWSHRYVQNVILPEVLTPGLDAGPQRGGNPDAGVAMAQGVLAAIDEGLAVCLAPFNEKGARDVLRAPETWEPVMAMFVGYPAESREAAGQEPRPAFESMFFEQAADQAFVPDPDVRERLRAAGMIQRPAPVPWREREVRALSRMLELPGGEGDEPA
ncbi:MAG: hypothetical protein Kow0010_23880 [Dehalococcoidia bacterium]